MEITQVDVFATQDWRSTEVTVLGFQLGMRREEVTAFAKTHALRIVDPLERAENCKGERCDVFTARGKPKGVSLTFGPDGKLQEILVDTCFDYGVSPPRWRAEWVCKRLKGETYNLVHHYSDELRRKLLGCGSRVFDWKNPVYVLHRTYEYPTRGIKITVEIDMDPTGEKPVQPPRFFWLALEPPRAAAN